MHAIVSEPLQGGEPMKVNVFYFSLQWDCRRRKACNKDI